MLTPTDRTARTLSRAGAGVLRNIVRTLVLGVSVIASTPVSAQSDLPADLPGKIQALTPADVAAIKAFVADKAADLGAQNAQTIGAAEAVKIKRARQAILQHLQDASVAPPFRIEYGKQLEPVLSRLASDKRDLVAINALLIAGELATVEGVAVLEKQIAGSDPVVRYTAARGMGLTFEAIERATPALTGDRAERMVKTLGERLSVETDPRVVDTLARALVAASRVTRQGFESLTERSLTELSRSLSARLAVNPEKVAIGPLLDTSVTAGVAMREALGNPARRLPDGARRKSAEFAGQVLALAGRALKSSPVYAPVQLEDSNETKADKTAARADLAEAVALAEAIIALGSDGSYRSQNLGSLVKPAVVEDDARFLVGLEQVTGRDGALIKPPFALSADLFKDPK